MVDAKGVQRAVRLVHEAPDADPVAAPQERVYQDLTTKDGFARWWTRADGEEGTGGKLEFFFGEPEPGLIAEVTEQTPHSHVVLHCIQGPAEWVGTKVNWDIRQEGDWTIVLFKHQGWKEPVEFMHHCSTKWGVFLLSLKSLLETGKGAPAPHDLKLDSWE